MLKDQSLTVTACTDETDCVHKSCEPYIRNEYILHYVVSGKGYYEVHGNIYELHAGESFLILPGTTVSYYTDTDDPWIYKWVDFIGTEAKNLISLTGFLEHPVSPACKEIGEIYSKFSVNTHLIQDQLYNAGLLRVLFARYMSLYPSKSNTSSINYLYIAKNYISLNAYRHTLRVSELAQKIGVERSYLYRLFMENDGVSPTEYITNYRLEKALQMMKDGISQVKLISLSVGYENPLYFSNCFKKKYGISPKNYMKTLRK